MIRYFRAISAMARLGGVLSMSSTECFCTDVPRWFPFPAVLLVDIEIPPFCTALHGCTEGDVSMPHLPDEMTDGWPAIRA